MFDHLENERLLILLKARQLGMSWVCCAYALWMCLFQRQKSILVMSKGKPEAQEMILRIKFIFNTLPDWLRDQCPTLERDTSTDSEWSNGSRVKSLAATEDAGSGYTVSMVILDEFAKMLFSEKTYTAVKPTIDAGGKLVIISTAKGIGNTFHKLWVKAESGLNKFFPFFLPWNVRPGRDEAWYSDKLAEESDPQNVKQEYPLTSQEAFLASGRARFAHDWIMNQQQYVENPLIDTDKGNIPPCFPHLFGFPGLKIYRLPEPGRKYIIGADPSQGTSTSNPSPATVIDADTWEEVALLNGRFEPTTFGQLLARLGKFYNTALLNVARNNHGHAVLAELVNNQGYQNMAYGPDKQLGWPENVKWKPVMIDDLADALKDDCVRVRSLAALTEMSIYQINDNGSTSAPEGYTDDIVTNWALCITYAKRPKTIMNSFIPQAMPQGQVHTVHAIGGQTRYDKYNPGSQVVPSSARNISVLPGRK